MKKAAYWIVASTLILSATWVALGVYVFFLIPEWSYSWTQGEAGDFLGGGLGAFAILIIAYTALLQQNQISSQKRQASEERVFRTFETLKPELENLSARISGKASPSDGGASSDFQKNREDFRKYDRTVFLREISKGTYDHVIRNANENSEIRNACERYIGVFQYIDGSCKDLGEGKGTLKEAIDQTDARFAYDKLKVLLEKNY